MSESTPDSRAPSNNTTPASDGQLIDGSPAAAADDVHQRLSALGCSFSSVSHPPMRTVEDSRKYRNGVPGGYSKNLFLRNKKGRMWLVTLLEDRAVDLRHLGEMIGAGRVSFCSEQRLMHYLGVIPGAVTPLAVINDRTQAVQAWIDADLLERDPLHFHPCNNSMTTTLNKESLLAYMSDCGHRPELLHFD